LPAQDDRWLRRFEPRPDASLRIVCFPHAGGSATFYRGWARMVAADAEIVAVEYPGRMTRITETLVGDVDELAEAIAAAVLRGVEPPLAFFGHSMGAAMAYETALRLTGDAAPMRLFASAKRGPAAHRPGVRHLVRDELLLDYLRHLGGTDPAFFDQPALVPFILPIIRSDVRLSETWEPAAEARVDCPISVLVGDDDPEVSVDEAATWRLATNENFEMHVFPGHHFYVLEHTAAVLDTLVGTCRRDLAERLRAWATPSSST
jgi:pyochelin biosynthetic protein PchC